MLLEADGEASATGHIEAKYVGCGHLLLGYDICLRIGGVVGIGSVGIDGGLVGAACLEEVEGHVDVALVLVGDATHEPLSALFGLAGYHEIVARLGKEVLGALPVDSYVLDELEGIHELLIVLGEVGSHLKGRVHGDVEGQLVGDGGVDLRVVVATSHRAEVHLEDTGRVVHRSAIEAGEGKDGHQVGLGATERLVLGAAGTLVADEVGVGAAETCWANGLVGIDHDMVLGSLGDGIEVVVDHPLAVVVLTARDDVAHVAALHGVVAILLHELVGLVHVALVVAHR